MNDKINAHARPPSFTGPPPPERFNMARYCLAGEAATTPDKPALIVVHDLENDEPAEVWTFAQIEDHVLRLASGLIEHGLKPGDRLFIRLANTPLYPIVFFAAEAAGIVPLATSSTLSEREVEFLLEDSRASAIALDDSLPPVPIPYDVTRLDAARIQSMCQDCERANWAGTNADDPAYLIYTSGTTSKPKGVLHAHRAAWGRRPMYKDWYNIGHNDRMLHAGAFNWTYTLGTGLTDPWANGATAIIYTGEKRPEIWPALIKRTQATLFAAVPGLFRQILKYADLSKQHFTTLRHALTAGEAPPPGLFDEWRNRTGTELYEALGMSEISTYISSAPQVPRKPGSIGKPQTGRAIAILSIEGRSDTPLPAGKEGLIAVHKSDPGLMLGYWNRPEEEAEVFRGNWFIGGDIGRMDEEGYITHLGRANDIMKAQGYRVAPQEVEAALIEHPEVSEVGCTELRVRDDVSVIAAFVVPLDWNAPPDPADILAFAEHRLAAYKRPREVRFVKSLPRTANGKVIRSSLA